MATNVDKAVYPATADVRGQPGAPAALEIELEVELDEGEENDNEPEAPETAEFGENLVESLDEGVVSALASDLTNAIDEDKTARRDWEKTYTEGLKLLGLKYEDRTEPWAGACGVHHPLLTEAIVRFQADTITETFPAQGPVRTKIIGKETPAKRAAAARVREDMNYRLTEEMPEYRPEHEKMLWSLPATGSAFKKVYYDPSLGRPVSVFVPAEDIILPYGTTDIRTCPRVTHRMRKFKNEILKLQEAGFYADVDIGEPTRQIDDIQKAKDSETGFSDLNDDRFELYEVHADLVIRGAEGNDDDADDVALPYVVTIIRNTNTVLSIRRNWKEDDDLRLKRQHFVEYQYIPGFGAYGFGLFHLIGGFAKSATSLMRQLVDAGTLANLPGGLKSRGLRIKGDDTPIAPGEFRDVDVAGGTIKDNILPLPYKEPSLTLYNLLTTIVENGRRFASSADVKFSDMGAQAPVGSTLAMLERELKPLTAVQARVHFAMKQELKLLAALVRDYTDDEYSYEPESGPTRAKKTDYQYVDIIPVSDPNAATMSQRVVQYQAAMQMSQMAPEIYDQPQLHRSMLSVLGIKNAEKIVPLPEDMRPRDPVTENMDVLRGKPVKAFAHQDHESHIQVHMAAANDPIIMQLVGQNPRAQQLQAAMMAHIAEHVAYAYRQKIEQRLGMALPPESEDGEEETMPPEVANQLASMMAMAAQEVLQQNQQLAAAQAAQQAAQDPLVQLQQKELEIKERNVAVAEKKLAIDAAAQADKLDLERDRLESQERLSGAKLGVDVERHHADQRRDGVKIALEAMKADRQADKPTQPTKQPPKPK